MTQLLSFKKIVSHFVREYNYNKAIVLLKRALTILCKLADFEKEVLLYLNIDHFTFSCVLYCVIKKLFHYLLESS
jgi:hypothetical protein